MKHLRNLQRAQMTGKREGGEARRCVSGGVWVLSTPGTAAAASTCCHASLRLLPRGFQLVEEMSNLQQAAEGLWAWRQTLPRG